MPIKNELLACVCAATECAPPLCEGKNLTCVNILCCVCVMASLKKYKRRIVEEVPGRRGGNDFDLETWPQRSL